MNKIVALCLALLLIITFSYLFAQELELIFSHKFHAEEVGTTCTDCHSAKESAVPTDNLLPDMNSCYNCHDEDEEKCSTCHKDSDNAIEYPRVTKYIAKFPHKKHSGEKFSCEKCHIGISKSENILAKHLPKMGVCIKCHDNKTQIDYCSFCHNKKENLKPDDHDITWNAEHGISTNIDKEICNTCHTNNMCLECHQNDNLDHKVHRLNFVNNHGISAKGNKDNCLTCHEEQAFCVDCHRQRMVMPKNHSTANWTNSVLGGRHARDAKFDLDACLSCHSDAAGDPVCVICHN